MCVDFWRSATQKFEEFDHYYIKLFMPAHCMLHMCILCIPVLIFGFSVQGHESSA